MNKFATFFFILIFFSCQKLHSQSRNWPDVASIEVNAALNTGRLIFETNPSTPSTSLFRDTVNYFIRTNQEVELKIKYVKEFYKNYAWFGGLNIGQLSIVDRAILRDTIFQFGGSGLSEFDEYTNKSKKIYHLALLGGIRAGLYIFKNDRINLSLAGKLNYFPSKDISYMENEFSFARNENVEIALNSTLESLGRLFPSIELEINYQLIPKSEKYRFLFGLFFNISDTTVFNTTTQIILPRNTHTFNFELRGGYLGAFVGFAYVLGKKNKEWSI